MASKIYNVMYPKNYVDNANKEQTTYIRVGTAFAMKENDGFTLELDLPLTFQQGGRLLLFVRDSTENGNGGTRPPANANANNQRSGGNNTRGGGAR